MNIPRRVKTKPDKLTRQVYLALNLLITQKFDIEYTMALFEISKYTLYRDILELNEQIGFTEGMHDYINIYCDHILSRHSKAPSSAQAKAHSKRFSRILRMIADYQENIFAYINKECEKIFKENLTDSESSEVAERTQLCPNAWYDKNTSSSEKRMIQRDYKVLVTAADILRSGSYLRVQSG